MDADGNFQQVAGKDDNPYFPDGPIGNLGAGLGNNSNQYIWRYGEHNGELYIGTYDTSTLTYQFTQITDGQVANMEMCIRDRGQGIPLGYRAIRLLAVGPVHLDLSGGHGLGGLAPAEGKARCQHAVQPQGRHRVADFLGFLLGRRQLSQGQRGRMEPVSYTHLYDVSMYRDTYDLVEYPDAYELINTYSTVMYVTRDDSGMSYVLDALGMMTQWSQINQPADCPAVAHPGQEQLLQIRDNLTKQDPVLAAIAPSQADPDRPVASSGDLYRLTDLEAYFARLSANYT